MTKTANGREPLLSQPLGYKLSRWPHSSTVITRQSTKITTSHYAPDCGHRGPRTRHVERLDGSARYLCRDCAIAALAAETQAATRQMVRARLDTLFVGSRPRITRSGGDFAATAATPTRLAFANFAERRARV